MEEATPLVTVRSAGVRYGLILGIISILLFLGMVLAGLAMDSPVRYVGLIIDAVIIYLAHQYFKQNGDGYMSFGQGFGISFWIGLIGSAISSVFTFIYLKFVDTTIVQQMMDAQVEKMQEQGMPDEQIEAGMKIAGMFMTPTAMAIMGVIFGVIFVCVIGILVTIFTQKKNPATSI